MPTTRVAQIPRAKGDFEIVQRPMPEPKAGWVRIRVQACGVCHSDVIVKEGLFPNIAYPRVPGHELIGIIDTLGPGVEGWSTGQRVGVGWNGGYCGHCDACRRGNFFACQTSSEVTGITFDGGYAEHMVAPVSALAMVPDDLTLPMRRR